MNPKTKRLGIGGAVAAGMLAIASLTLRTHAPMGLGSVSTPCTNFGATGLLACVDPGYQNSDPTCSGYYYYDAAPIEPWDPHWGENLFGSTIRPPATWVITSTAFLVGYNSNQTAPTTGNTWVEVYDPGLQEGMAFSSTLIATSHLIANTALPPFHQISNPPCALPNPPNIITSSPVLFTFASPLTLQAGHDYSFILRGGASTLDDVWIGGIGYNTISYVPPWFTAPSWLTVGGLACGRAPGAYNCYGDGVLPQALYGTDATPTPTPTATLGGSTPVPVPTNPATGCQGYQLSNSLPVARTRVYATPVPGVPTPSINVLLTATPVPPLTPPASRYGLAWFTESYRSYGGSPCIDYNGKNNCGADDAFVEVGTAPGRSLACYAIGVYSDVNNLQCVYQFPPDNYTWPLKAVFEDQTINPMMNSSCGSEGWTRAGSFTLQDPEGHLLDVLTVPENTAGRATAACAWTAPFGSWCSDVKPSPGY